MSDEPLIKKRVDESWKEQVEREKRAAPPAGKPQAPGPGPSHPAQPAPPQHPTDHSHGPEDSVEEAPLDEPALPEPDVSDVTGPEGLPEARFDLFVSGLAMEALISLGDMAHPVTRRKSANLAQAKYLIDVLGILEEKTAGNLSVNEQRMLQDTLYQLRMRYMRKSGGVAGP